MFCLWMAGFEVVWGHFVKLDVDVKYAQKQKMVEDSQRYHMINNNKNKWYMSIMTS